MKVTLPSRVNDAQQCQPLIKLLILLLLMISIVEGGKKEKDKKGTCGVQVVAIEQIKYKAVPVEVVEEPDPYLMKMMASSGKTGNMMVISNDTTSTTTATPPVAPTEAPSKDSYKSDAMMEQMMKMMMKYTTSVAMNAALSTPMPAVMMNQMDPGVEIPMKDDQLMMPRPGNGPFYRPPSVRAPMRPQIYSNRPPMMSMKPMRTTSRPKKVTTTTAAPTTTTTTTATPTTPRPPTLYIIPMPGMTNGIPNNIQSPIKQVTPIGPLSPMSKDLIAPPMYTRLNGPLPMMSNSVSNSYDNNNIFKSLSQIMIPQKLEMVPLEIPTLTTTPPPPPPTTSTTTEAPPVEETIDLGDTDDITGGEGLNQLEDEEEEQTLNESNKFNDLKKDSIQYNSEGGERPMVNANIHKNFVDEDEKFGRHKLHGKSQTRPFSSNSNVNDESDDADDESDKNVDEKSIDINSIEPNRNLGVRIMNPQMAQQLFNQHQFHGIESPSFAEMLVSRGGSVLSPYASSTSQVMSPASSSSSLRRRNSKGKSRVDKSTPSTDSTSNQESIISKIKGSLSRMMTRSNQEKINAQQDDQSISALIDRLTSNDQVKTAGRASAVGEEVGGGGGIQVINL